MKIDFYIVALFKSGSMQLNLVNKSLNFYDSSFFLSVLYQLVVEKLCQNFSHILALGFGFFCYLYCLSSTFFIKSVLETLKDIGVIIGREAL